MYKNFTYHFEKKDTLKMIRGPRNRGTGIRGGGMRGAGMRGNARKNMDYYEYNPAEASDFSEPSKKPTPPPLSINARYQEKQNHNDEKETEETFYLHSEQDSKKTRPYDTGISNFKSTIAPLLDLKPLYSDLIGEVEIRTRRKNKTVTFQLEPFSGYLAFSGVAYVHISQAIGNPPPYVLEYPISITYNGECRVTSLVIDPFDRKHMIKIFLQGNKSSLGTAMGDQVSVSGSCLQWIVN
jgi:hypothetical protein